MATEIKTIIREHLSKVKVMQLATAAGDQPWVCNVHFDYDDDYNLYWMSVPHSRHSEEVARNPHVGVALAVQTDPPLIGVQIEGDAVMVEDLHQYTAVLNAYGKRHEREGWIEELLQSPQPSMRLYKLTPRLIAIFDQKNFPDVPKQEWRP